MCNSEAWNNITLAELELLESVDLMLLKGVLKAPKYTQGNAIPRIGTYSIQRNYKEKKIIISSLHSKSRKKFHNLQSIQSSAKKSNLKRLGNNSKTRFERTKLELIIQRNEKQAELGVPHSKCKLGGPK